jgi:hypothetical protein
VQSTALHRRSVLGTVGVALVSGLTGCAAAGSTSAKAVDLVVHNEASVRRSVTVRVTETSDGSSSGSDEQARIDTTLELVPNGRHEFNNELRANETYSVEIAFEPTDGDGEQYSATYDWSSVDGTLHVLLTGQVVFAKQVG